MPTEPTTDPKACDLPCDLCDTSGRCTFACEEAKRLSVLPTTDPKAVSLEEALKPFAAVFKLNEPLAENWPDDKPNHSFSPGLWPTWGDFKRAAATLANHEAQARGGVDREAVARLEEYAGRLESHARLYPTPVSAAATDRQRAADIRGLLALPAHQPRQEGED